MNIIIKPSDKQVLDIKILKKHLRIEHDHEDVYLKEVIDMATDILEKNIEKPILIKTYKYIFQSDDFFSTKQIPLPVTQVKNIISVKKILNCTQKEKIKFAVKINRDKTFVITNGTKLPIEIIYEAGITNNETEIPKDLSFAVLQIAKNIYECSEEDVLESKYIKHIINSNRTLYID